MKKINTLIIAVAMVFQCFTAYAEDFDGWTDMVVGDFGSATATVAVSQDKAYSGNNAVSMKLMNTKPKDETKYLELKNTLSALAGEGTYTLTYYVSKNNISKDVVPYLGSQEITVTVSDSTLSGWKKYSAVFDYTGEGTDSLSFRMYEIANSYFIDDVSLVLGDSSENLVTNPGFEGTQTDEPDEPDIPDNPDEPDVPDIPDNPSGYPDIKTEMTVYQPGAVLLSSNESAYVVNWRNPAANTLNKVSLYNITGGEEILLSDTLSAVPSDSVYYEVKSLTVGKNYQFKIVFSFDDNHDYTYFIGDKLDNNNVIKGAWTAQRIKNKGVKFSPTSFELDTGESKDGNVSAKFITNVNKSVKDFSECYIRLNNTVADMDLTEGNSYKVSFWVKAQNSSENMEGHMSWSMFSHGNSQISDTKGTFDWKYKEYIYKCGSNAKNMLVFTYSGCVDSLWIDDVKIFKLENGVEVGENLIKNGSFEDILTGDLSVIEEVNAIPGVGGVTLDWNADENYNGANIYTVVNGHFEWRGRVSKDVKKITIDKLYQDKEYTYLVAPINGEGVEGEAVQVTFKTLYEDFTISQPTLTKGGAKAESVKDGGKYTVTVSAKNNTVAEGFNCKVLAAVFNSDDVLTGVYSAEKKIEKSSPNSPADTIEVEMEIRTGSYMQVSVIDSVESFERFMETVIY